MILAGCVIPFSAIPLKKQALPCPISRGLEKTYQLFLVLSFLLTEHQQVESRCHTLELQSGVCQLVSLSIPFNKSVD